MSYNKTYVCEYLQNYNVFRKIKLVTGRQHYRVAVESSRGDALPSGNSALCALLLFTEPIGNTARLAANYCCCRSATV